MKTELEYYLKEILTNYSKIDFQEDTSLYYGSSVELLLYEACSTRLQQTLNNLSKLKYTSYSRGLTGVAYTFAHLGNKYHLDFGHILTEFDGIVFYRYINSCNSFKKLF